MLKLHPLVIAALLASLSAVAAEPPASASKAPPSPAPLASPDLISWSDANRVALAAMQECARRGQPTSLAVFDANGFQRIAYSDDNAKLIGVVHSGRKAAAVLAFKASSTVLQKRLETDKAFADQYARDERYLFMAGGLPIYRGTKLVAVISVGGAGDVNEECAGAGVKALSWATTEPKP